MLLVICPTIFSAQNGPVLTGKKMEVLKKGQQVIFSDGAEIKDETMKISAETIIHNRPNNFLETKNNVHIHHILKSSATIDIFGDNGYYHLSQRRGYLSGNPGRVEYLPVDSAPGIELQCRQIDFNLNTQEVSGQQEVNVLRKDSRVRADNFRGTFTEQNSFLNFAAVAESKVESFYNYTDTYDLYFYSRQLDFYPEQKLVKLRGQVVTKIVPK